MKLLALDTSTDACSVALVAGEQTELRHVVEARAHTRLLMPMIQELLAEGGFQATALDAVVLGNGPGSFIGVRIAASVAQGLAFAADVPMVTVSSLEVIAAEAFATSDLDQVVVTQDARMDEVYLADFHRNSDDLPQPSGETVLHRATEPVPVTARAGGVGLAGGGHHRYPSLADRFVDPPQLLDELRFPRADYLLRCGAPRVVAGETTAPEDLTPAYVRSKVASVPGSR